MSSEVFVQVESCTKDQFFFLITPVTLGNTNQKKTAKLNVTGNIYNEKLFRQTKSIYDISIHLIAITLSKKNEKLQKANRN